MNTIHRLRHWARGLGKLHGFGIQSPWAYDFVKEVIAERSPYYKYEELDKNSHAKGHEQRVGHLLLRIANYCQPQTIYIGQATPPTCPAYLKAGCEQASPVSNPQDAQLLLLSAHTPDVGETIRQLPATVRQQPPTILILGINDTSDTIKKWNQIISIPPITLTFNLWEMGIAFTQERYQPQHYILNF